MYARVFDLRHSRGSAKIVFRGSLSTRKDMYAKDSATKVIRT